MSRFRRMQTLDLRVQFGPRLCPSSPGFCTQHFVDELGSVLDLELARDVRAVEFHRAMANHQVPRRFLA